MLNERQPKAIPESEPSSVVVTTQSPSPAEVHAEAVPRTTQVDVYPSRTGSENELATARGAQRLHAGDEVVRQRRYGVGKTIDLVWYILGVLDILLAARFFFELTAANSAAGFVKFILAISQPFAWPFNGIFPVPREGNNILDLNILVAMVVYAVAAWLITRLLAMTIEPPSVT